MTLTLLLFATLRTHAGTGRVTLDVPDPATVASLKAALAAAVPALAEHLPHALVSVNHEFAFPDDPIHEGDEIALFPPVSGGAGRPRDAISNLQSPITIYHITTAPLDLNALLASITLPTTGAACVFTGMVRGRTQRDGLPHETEYLEYEAYPPMAEAKMQQVAEEIRDRWPAVEGIAIVQRVGRLDPGTPTVLIACSAA
ncbi:MAG: molybdenum cofactor biosynthesis protein MoaE, partial [Chloroflexi bacterium]|nr:molybdenum cofactor biosynthesis protein MoaE [Chloroflexota bacterium]